MRKILPRIRGRNNPGRLQRLACYSGIQFESDAILLQGDEQQHAIDFYQQRFPLLPMQMRRCKRPCYG